MFEPTIDFAGNLTRNAELKGSAGNQFLTLTVAMTPGFTAVDSTTNQRTWTNREAIFLDLTVNGKIEQLNALLPVLQKGVKVVGAARVYVRNYERKDGTQGTSINGYIHEDRLGVGLLRTHQTVNVTPSASSNAGGYQQQGNVNYSAPQGGSASDPWATAPAQGQQQATPPANDPWAAPAQQTQGQAASSASWGEAPPF